MANFTLFLAILCAGASFVFYTAANIASGGAGWASSVCSTARVFCHSPLQMGYVAAGLAALWVVMKFVSAVRG
jgi:hypothetical protein